MSRASSAPSRRKASRVSKVQFLGGTALLPHGPFKLAALLGCPVLLMIGLRERDKAYAIHVERFAEPRVVVEVDHRGMSARGVDEVEVGEGERVGGVAVPRRGLGWALCLHSDRDDGA